MSAEANDTIEKILNRKAVNNLLDELRREKYADIKTATAPNVFDYQDYKQYLLDRDYYENKLLANSYLFHDDIARQKEIREIRARREKESRRDARNFYLKVMFYIFGLAIIFYLGLKN